MEFKFVTKNMGQGKNDCLYFTDIKSLLRGQLTPSFDISIEQPDIFYKII